MLHIKQKTIRMRYPMRSEQTPEHLLISDVSISSDSGEVAKQVTLTISREPYMRLLIACRIVE